MTVNESRPSSEVPCFREAEPVELWSARLMLHLPYDDFERIVVSAAIGNGQRYTGFITKDIEGIVTSLREHVIHARSTE
jgi:hypothetical protein